MLVALNRFQFQFWSFLVLFEAVWALLRFRDMPPVALGLRPRVLASSRAARILLPDDELFAIAAGAGEPRYGACCEGVHYGRFAIGKRIAGNLLWKTC